MNRSHDLLLLLGATLIACWGGSVIQPMLQANAQVGYPSKPSQPPQVDLSVLRERLQVKDWQAADAETRRILYRWVHPRDDIFGPPIATNVPPEILQTLDRLWSEASGGRFGFSAQKRIWDEVRTQHSANSDRTTKAFGDRVGWTRPVPDRNNFVSPDWLTEPELSYSLQAPIGHLPWAGIAWERIDAMLKQQSCGSCMVDALYLQGERFNRYLPNLFNWLSTALTDPLPPEGSWQQPRFTHAIDLRALYPDRSCPVYSRAQAISPDSTLVAISSYSYERACGGGPSNSTFALWNAQRGTRIITLLRGQAQEAFSDRRQAQEPPTEGTRIVGDVVNAVAFTPDSRLIVAGLSNGTIRLWTTDQGKLVRTLSGHRYAVRTIAMSADGQWLVSGSSDQTVKLWNLQTGQLLRTIQLNPADGIVHTLLISADGQRLVTATERNTLQLWDLQTGQRVQTLVERETRLPPGLAIALSPDGQKVATADRDRTIKLWNANTGAKLVTLKGHRQNIQHLAFSPDSQLLASSEDKKAYLWNLRTYQPVQTFDLIQSAGHPIMPNNLGYVSFSPDGKVLATSTLLLPLVESEPIPRQGLTLWDVATGKGLWQIHDVSQFQFSPNGQFLLAKGQIVQFWQPYRSLINSQALPSKN